MNGGRPVTASPMLECVETFGADYDGELVRLIAGVSRVGAEHEIVRRFPEKFRRVDGNRSRRIREAASTASRQPACEMTLEEELQIRRNWIAAIDQRARDRESRYGSATASSPRPR